MKYLTIDQMIDDHTTIVSNQLKSMICPSTIEGISCTNSKCLLVHTAKQFHSIKCNAGKLCCAPACPMNHLSDEWADEEDNDEEILQTLNKNNILTYLEIDLMNKALKIRNTSYSLLTMYEILTTYQLTKVENIYKDLKPRDTNGLFRLFQNDNLDNNSPDAEKAIRGIIVDNNDDVIVSTFPFVDQITIEDPSFQEKVNEELKGSIIVNSYDGSIIRLWNYPVTNEWHMSTTRKIDAHTSKWNSSISLADRFKDSLNIQLNKTFDEFCSVLDPNNVYVFLITTDPKTRKVCFQDEQRVYSLGRFDRSKNFNYRPVAVSGIPFPEIPNNKIMLSAEDVAEALQDPNNEDITSLRIQGYTFINAKGKMFKVASLLYDKALKIRGNSPNRFVDYVRYYRTNLTNFYTNTLYPEDKKEFEFLHNAMDCYVNFLKTQYELRMKHKRFTVQYEPFEYKTLRALTSLHKSKSISTNKVELFLREQLKDNKFSLDLLRYFKPDINMLPTPAAIKPVSSSSKKFYPVSFGTYKPKV